MKQVVIMQYRLLHYRTALFERLRARCAEVGINVEIVHGSATRRERPKNDEGFLEWAWPVNNVCVEFGARDFIWQPLPKKARGADLIVVMQESRIISNYPLLLKRRLRGPRMAYWGHGKNFQSDAPTGLREWWKNLLLKQVDWWFAYTELTANILEAAGFPSDRVTVLNNAIDTAGFKRDLSTISDQDLAITRAAIDIRAGQPVGVFCGSLYADKKLEFLVAASDHIRRRLCDFTLLVIGDGPSMSFMRDAQKSRPWIRLLGVRKGLEKASYFRCADVMLNPGLVGLHIVDAFCAGLVMVTTNNAKHSPEVAYLREGSNGFATADCPKIYGDAVVALFADKNKLQRMKAAAIEDSKRYSLDNMVENFAKGIERALRT